MYSDPDASWGHRSAVSTRKGGGFYGYKIHAAVCATRACRSRGRSRRARANESLYVAPLLDAVKARGYDAETVAMDRGYDNNRVYAECHERGVSRSSRSARVGFSLRRRSSAARTSGRPSTAAARQSSGSSAG